MSMPIFVLEFKSRHGRAPRRSELTKEQIDAILRCAQAALTTRAEALRLRAMVEPLTLREYFATRLSDASAPISTLAHDFGDRIMRSIVKRVRSEIHRRETSEWWESLALLCQAFMAKEDLDSSHTDVVKAVFFIARRRAVMLRGLSMN